MVNCSTRILVVYSILKQKTVKQEFKSVRMFLSLHSVMGMMLVQPN